MADIALEDIGGESCEPIAGLSTQIYYSLHGDYLKIEDPKDLCGTLKATNFAELVEIPATPGHIMKKDKQMFKVDIITETGNIKSTQIGEKGRRLFQNELVCEVSGSYPEILGFFRWIKNQKLVMFAEEFGSGQIRQFGSKRLPAWVEANESTIEGSIEGKNSGTITIMDKQKWPAAIYKGVLQLVPALEIP